MEQMYFYEYSHSLEKAAQQQHLLGKYHYISLQIDIPCATLLKLVMQK